ncbi:MAG: EhaF family protein [Methanobacterium paludis]|uniref:(NiFe)-hydrogenase-3-type complex Eha, membrane protein EhaF n=1 Tax=Methanobacterium paludis (strain DSM 25820 / JCM 18151 / SWAN1) TaxID=868131 RepID=F6D2N5_METPW|nr:EhaF family protein [Methanobacterium paludis]AEG17969.1 (NiFe)-hydrogenase-3-type complex Eha, membrane protein EhaF [Methanobacterium paludis]MCE7698446.1 EhaF family protein [Methanobacterium paludis]
MKSLGRIWNSLANPKSIPRVYAAILGIILIAGFIIPLALNDQQLYPKPAPQSEVAAQNPLAPYDRGGTPFVEKGTVKAQYPQFSPAIGQVTAYLSPIAIWVKSTTRYFGTSIYSSPGGLIDEILYYTRGFDTVLESTILMMAFTIASWVAIHFTMRREED